MRDDRPHDLTLARDGAVLHKGAAVSLLPSLEQVSEHHSGTTAGVRLSGDTVLASILSPHSAIGAIAAALLGPLCRPVRAILFDKNADRNWALGWHQDRTIAVRARRATAGFGPWTVKHGLIHVAPPFTLLAGMVTLRVHLDAVPAENAPLRISPGSHSIGLVPVDRVTAIVRDHGERSCTAYRGDIWCYATPILHASDRAAVPTRRRVLQVDYAAGDLPGGLEWLGIAND